MSSHRLALGMSSLSDSPLVDTLTRSCFYSQSSIGETRLQIRQSFTLDAHLGRNDVIANGQGGWNNLDTCVIDEGRKDCAHFTDIDNDLSYFSARYTNMDMSMIMLTLDSSPVPSPPAFRVEYVVFDLDTLSRMGARGLLL